MTEGAHEIRKLLEPLRKLHEMIRASVVAASERATTGELSAVRFVSSDPNQLLATAGFTWSALESLDLSVVGLFGFLAGSDKYGVLLGVSPNLRLFGGKSQPPQEKPP